MADCSPDEPVEWSHFYALGKQLDQLAEDLNNPVYTPTDELLGTPWPMPDTVKATFWQRFEVSVTSDQGLCDTVVITSRFLAKADGSVYDFPQSEMEDLADNEELFFISDKTPCWCKTVFQVPNDVGGYTLEETDPTGCCQTLPVPAVGDALCYNQFFIPAGFVKAYAVIHENHTGPFTRQVRPCRSGKLGDVLFFYEPAPTDEAPSRCVLVAAQRKISGTFTWRVKGEWIGYLMAGLETLQFCEWTGGATANTILERGEAAGFIGPGCETTTCDFFWSGSRLWGNSEDPGALSCEETDCCFPWTSVCCDAENCESVSKPKVYCETLKQLETILDNVASVLKPMTEFDVASPDSNCLECCDPGCLFDHNLPSLDDETCDPDCTETFELLNGDALLNCLAKFRGQTDLKYIIKIVGFMVVTGIEGTNGSLAINGETYSATVPPDAASASTDFELEIDVEQFFGNILVTTASGPHVSWTASCEIEKRISEA